MGLVIPATYPFAALALPVVGVLIRTIGKQIVPHEEDRPIFEDDDGDQGIG